MATGGISGAWAASGRPVYPSSSTSCDPVGYAGAGRVAKDRGRGSGSWIGRACSWALHDWQGGAAPPLERRESRKSRQMAGFHDAPRTRRVRRGGPKSGRERGNPCRIRAGMLHRHTPDETGGRGANEAGSSKQIATLRANPWNSLRSIPLWVPDVSGRWRRVGPTGTEGKQVSHNRAPPGELHRAQQGFSLRWRPLVIRESGHVPPTGVGAMDK